MTEKKAKGTAAWLRQGKDCGMTPLFCHCERKGSSISWPFPLPNTPMARNMLW